MSKAQKKVESLANSGLLGSAMDMLGGMGGLSEAAGHMFIQNQNHIVAGINALEKKHEKVIAEGGFEGLTYMLAVANVKGKEKIAIILFPYKSVENQEGITLQCGNSLETHDLDSFIQMVIKGAKNVTGKNGNKK